MAFSKDKRGESEPKKDKEILRDGLTFKNFCAYAVSHFSNDLCAAAWFTYVLFYVKEVVLLDSTIAGFVMLSG